MMIAVANNCFTSSVGCIGSLTFESRLRYGIGFVLIRATWPAIFIVLDENVVCRVI